MTVTKRQFNHLNAMGIDLWCHRTTGEEGDVEQSLESNSFLPIDYQALSSLKVFNDIIASLGLSLGEISYKNKCLNLGLIDWRFGHDLNISLKENTLITPDIEILKTSAQLKRQLWQIIQENALS